MNDKLQMMSKAHMAVVRCYATMNSISLLANALTLFKDWIILIIIYNNNFIVQRHTYNGFDKCIQRNAIHSGITPNKSHMSF
jgi:hypothetical protein